MVSHSSKRADNTSFDSHHWSSTLIKASWQFTTFLWSHRNQIVLGATVEENALKTLQGLHAQIEQHYAA